MSSGTRRGVTLIELLVTLSILSGIAGVTTLAVRRLVAPAADSPQQILADSLRLAVATGRPIRVRIIVGGRWVNALVGIDGSILADSGFGIERFTGRPVNAR
jgi:prepilin-type N-terminal cleavage/methylation domain-containing protein